MTDAAKIAASLTKAQREALLRGWGSARIARALKAKKLSSGYLGSDPRNVAIVETELGLAVRAELERMNDAE